VVQAAIARDLGLRQHLLDIDDAVGSRPLLEQALQLNSVLSMPILNAWQPAYLALARRGRLGGVQTILTGTGGDEWLTVAPELAADLIRRGAFVELTQFLGTLRRSFPQHPFDLARMTLWTSGLRPLASLALDRIMPRAYTEIRLKRMFGNDPSWVAPDRQLRAAQRQRAEIALASPVSQQGFYIRQMRSALDHPLVSWQLEEQHQLGQQVGVRFFRPFCDPDMVEMLYRTPPRILNQGGRTKGLVRGTIARRFPTLGFGEHRKLNATSFYRSIMLHEAPALASSATDFPALSRLGVVDGKAAGAAVREGIKRENRLFQRLFHIFSLEAWARFYA
jgi:hypothetical protein